MKSLKVTTVTGQEEEVTVRTFQVGEYEQALPYAVKDDEASLIELACNRHAKWADTLTPESYEALAEALQKENRCFFARSARRRAALALTEIIAGAVSSGSSRG